MARKKEAAGEFQKVLDLGRKESSGTALWELSGALSELGQKEEAALLLEELYYELPKHRLSRDAGRQSEVSLNSRP